MAGDLVASDPLRRATVPALRRAAHRWPDNGLIRSATFHLGTGLARKKPQVLGSLSTGSPIVLDMRDPAHRMIMFTGSCESETTRLFHRLATPGWTVLDVGANAGYFSLLALDLGGATSQIHAFEPNPPMTAMVRSSVQQAEAEDAIHVRELACGATAGTAELHVSSDPTDYAFSTIRSDIGEAREWSSIEIEVVDLDSYCAANELTPNLMKLDAEGYEPAILDGMADMLAEGSPRYLICEVVEHPRRPDPALIVEKMAQHGYRCFQIVEDGSLDEGPVVGKNGNLCFVAPGQPVV